MRHHQPAYQSHGKLGTLALLVVAAGLLGGCETSGGPSNPVSELVAYSSGAQASARAPSRPEERQQAERPKSRAQAAMDCWASAEKSRSGGSLEARADFVNTCIENKLKPAGGNAEAKSDAKSDAKPAPKPDASSKPRQRAEAKPAS